jgi:hypothetical protein
MAKRRRIDPYTSFNFQLAFGAALAAIGGFALVRRLLRRRSAEYLYPGVYVSEVPSGSRPIEGVATSTSARAAVKTKKESSPVRSGSSAGARTKGAGRQKGR